MVLVLKYGSHEKVPFSCRCSILLGLTFVEIKNSFTKTLWVFDSKNFRIICYWRKTDESDPTYLMFQYFRTILSIIFYNSLICLTHNLDNSLLAIQNHNLTVCLNELKVCKVSWTPISKRCWKFQLSILTNKKSIIHNGG